jgi:hypothetical protein
MFNTGTKAMIINNNDPVTKGRTWFNQNEQVIGKIVTIKNNSDTYDGYRRYEIEFEDKSVFLYNHRVCLEYHIIPFNSNMTFQDYIDLRNKEERGVKTCW